MKIPEDFKGLMLDTDFREPTSKKQLLVLSIILYSTNRIASLIRVV
jgi:hypothetical protein